MIRFSRPWPAKEGDEDAGLLGFARIAVSAIRSCFFDCFRTGVSYSHIDSSLDSEVAVREDAVSVLELSDDESVRNGGEDKDPLMEELDVRELKEEAKFLKACGTLLQTPVEIRKASRKLAETSSEKEVERSWTFKSWLPNASIEKLKVDKQCDESPSPVKFLEEWVTWTGFSAGSPSSMAGKRSTRRHSDSSVESSDVQNLATPIVLATSVNCKNKSVRFKCESDGSAVSSKGSLSDSSSQDSEKSGNFTLSRSSPFPTPLKLSDNMQTPGTVFPSYMKNTAPGRTARIRSQYVYSVLNPVNYSSQGELLKDENSDPNHPIESLKLNDEASLTSTPFSNKVPLVEEDMKEEPSLSSWLKPQSETGDANNEQNISDENVHSGRTSKDSPIPKMVGTHSNGQVPSSSSPELWDGNGIESSTYKIRKLVCMQHHLRRD